MDIVSKQSTHLLDLFRPEMIYIHEDFRAAGRDLAKFVMAWIDGADPASLQFIAKPSNRSK